MRSVQLIRRNLGHYRRTNAAVVGGVAVAVAVLAGALLVGDSVRGSLRSLFLQRLGRTSLLVTSTGFFREGLAAEIGANQKFAANGFGAACPVVALNGAVIHDESGRRAGGVAVYGVDARFWEFHGLSAVQTPTGSEVLISPGLARELGAKASDSVRVRVEKPSAIPVESLHGRKEDVGRTVRLTVREVLAAERLGEFSPRAQQGEVRAVFVSLARLQKEAGREGKANALLLSSVNESAEAADGAARVATAEQLLRETFALEDLGLNLRVLDTQKALSLESESALLTEETAARARAAARDAGLRPVGVFSYLANTIRANGHEIPYSLVTALEPEGFGRLAQSGAGANSTNATTAAAASQPQQTQTSPVLLNEWAARDLGVKVGDEVEIEYYLWREEGLLASESAKFRLAGVVPIAGLAADRELTPEYPGISDTESLSDWDPPFPVDLSRVREQDEKYWDAYRTTPKAFITLARGQELWRTRFGNLTSLRLYPADANAETNASVDLVTKTRAEFARRLRAATDPLSAGLSVLPVREEGLRASAGATDFGEYFLYFSFFIVVSALLLASLFFKFGVEQRVREIGLMQAVGFPDARVRRLFLAEGFALAAAGSLLGLAGALAYGWLMMWGLRTWWVDAVGTRSLQLHVSPVSLAAGAVGGVLAALVCVWLSLRALRRVSTRSLLAGVFEREATRGRGGAGARGREKDRDGIADAKSEISNPQFEIASPQSAIRNPQSTGRFPASLFLAFACGALGLTLLALGVLKVVGEAAGFFGAGVLLLVALLAAQSAWLRRGRPGGAIGARGAWPVARLGFRNAAHRPGRSVLCVALVASAAFIIVSVDAFRQDAHGVSADRKSGAGGYALVAETLLPVAHDPNSKEGREALGLDVASDGGKLDGVSFARFRLRPGDDASCLNLYQPRDPRVLSAAPGFLRENRFGFQSSLAETDAERENPWLLLEKDFGDGAIPAAADAKSLAYVLHKKLGDEIVVKGGSGQAVRLRVVAALADSLFQSELVVAEKNFLRAFPERQGYRYFLIDAPAEREPAVAGVLEETLSDYGFDAASTAERLAGYHRVENTYLSTFQTLGGLGMLLGTLGLAAVLLRNVFERRRELALLRAVGYGPRQISVMVFGENALLLVAGLLTGTACALLAIAPAWIARAGTGRGPNLSLALLLAAVLVTGFAASLAATLAALRSPLLPALRAE
jgi:ABC-type lipoprotein release transport system permease subunit